MLILVHAAPVTLARHRHPNLGVLSSPRRWYRDVAGWKWAADNDAFGAWDAGRFREMLAGLAELDGGLFVTIPDVVADGPGTLARFSAWLDATRQADKPVALVIQDGMTAADLPWGEFEAVFIGGSSTWKLGPEAFRITQEAKERGYWVHMGRVNTHQRVRYAKAIGCDSIDGTSFSRYRDRWLADFLAHAAAPAQQLLPG